LPGIGKHFIGNTCCSSDDSVMQLIHILHLFTVKQCLLQTPRQAKSGEGGQECVPLYLSNYQETPYPDRHEHNRRNEVFHLDGAPPHFWLLDRRRGTHSLAPLLSRFESSGLFLLGVCKGLFIVKKCKMWMSYVTEFRAAVCVKCLTNLVKKTNTVLLRVVPQMVPVMRSTDHIRNFASSSVWKCISFSNTLYSWR